MTPFIVVGMPRTGSTLLLRTLREHPDIRAYGELFHWVDAERMSWGHTIHQKSATISYDVRSGNPMEFLREWVWCPANASHRAVGFKIFAQHVVDNSSPGFFRLLLQEFPDLHVIHVRRLDYLAVLVSWLMANKTGEWSLRPGDASGKATGQTLSPTAVEAEAFFSRMEQADNFFACELGCRRYLAVDYKELSRYYQETCNDVFDFLGVRQLPAVPSLKKQIDRDLSDVVTNYAQLREHFSRSRYAEFFPQPAARGISTDQRQPHFSGTASAFRFQLPKIKL